MRISIGVTTYQRKKLSEWCIASIYERTPRDAYELIVVDNGSTDGTQKMLLSMKKEGIIDKVILNKENLYLGAAINQYYKASSPSSQWLVAFSNDNFVMHGWFENFVEISKVFKADYIFCLLRPQAFHRKKYVMTKNGGVYLKKAKTWPPDRVLFGSGLAIKRSLVFKYKLWFLERKYSYIHGEERPVFAPYSQFLREVHNKNLKGYELGKPCALTQNCEFNNPKFKSYYMKVFKERDNLGRYEYLKERGYTRFPEKYFDGSDYEWKR